MSKQDLNKDKELKRLAGEVFEGAPDWCTHAAMDKGGMWFWHGVPVLEPTIDGFWWHAERANRTCKNQPVTDLPWTETLLRRGDYE